MEKLDNVIAGLTSCVKTDCRNCEYKGEYNGGRCLDRLLTDTLSVIGALSAKYATAVEAAAIATELAAKYRKTDGDLISRSELYGIESLLMTDIVENDPVAKFVLEQVLHDIQSVPSVDAEPVVHGRWVMKETMIKSPFAKNYYCSECQTEGSSQWKRCPVCEAKMDGERKTDADKSM